MTHNNLCLTSIYVTLSGEWRLGGLEHLCHFNDIEAESLSKYRTKKNQATLAPEEKVTFY